MSNIHLASETTELQRITAIMAIAEESCSTLEPVATSHGEDLLAQFISNELNEGLEGEEVSEMQCRSVHLMQVAKVDIVYVIESLESAAEGADTKMLAEAADNAYHGGELQITVRDLEDRGDSLATFISDAIFEFKQKDAIVSALTTAKVRLEHVIAALEEADA